MVEISVQISGSLRHWLLIIVGFAKKIRQPNQRTMLKMPDTASRERAVS